VATCEMSPQPPVHYPRRGRPFRQSRQPQPAAMRCRSARGDSPAGVQCPTSRGSALSDRPRECLVRQPAALNSFLARGNPASTRGNAPSHSRGNSIVGQPAEHAGCSIGLQCCIGPPAGVLSSPPAAIKRLTSRGNTVSCIGGNAVSGTRGNEGQTTRGNAASEKRLHNPRECRLAHPADNHPGTTRGHSPQWLTVICDGCYPQLTTRGNPPCSLAYGRPAACVLPGTVGTFFGGSARLLADPL
jgi:hypothetical protein